jgi:hypothetical protein
MKRSIISQLAFPIPIEKVNDQSKSHPTKENNPTAGRDLNHQVEAAYHTQDRNK